MLVRIEYEDGRVEQAEVANMVIATHDASVQIDSLNGGIYLIDRDLRSGMEVVGHPGIFRSGDGD